MERSEYDIEYAMPLIIFQLVTQMLAKRTHTQRTKLLFIFGRDQTEIWCSFKINKLFPVQWIHFENDNIFFIVTLHAERIH